MVCRKFRQTTFSFKFVYTLSTHLYPHTHEGCDSLSLAVIGVQLCFNPHTHEGCDNKRAYVIVLIVCFNPHTHEGCDAYLVFASSRFCSFNPHTHEGCDQMYLQAHRHTTVSIHTPTKGVTRLAKVWRRR